MSNINFIVDVPDKIDINIDTTALSDIQITSLSQDTLTITYGEGMGVQGYKGEQGNKGDKGEKGDKGDTGNTGSQGIPGAKGDKGEKGDQGDKGLKGDKSEKGDIGLQGIQGEPGTKGDTGSQGIPGVKGDTGSQGLKGDKGDQGIQGVQGNSGTNGINGTTPTVVFGSGADIDRLSINGVVSGPHLTGSQGLQGVQGTQGIQGVTGLKGDTGAQGIPGNKGDTGDAGAQGIQGISGVKGDKGDAGSQGLQGLQGIQGIQGAKGDTGSVGPNTSYSLQAGCASQSVTTDAQTMYWGGMISAVPSTTADRTRIYIPFTGTIKAVYVYSYASTAGTNENWSMYIRKNNTTDTLIQTLGASTSARVWSSVALNIAVNQGDYIEIKEIQPTWVTNPATVTRSAVIFIQP